MNQPNFNPFNDDFDLPGHHTEFNSHQRDRLVPANPDSSKITSLHLVSPKVRKSSPQSEPSPRDAIDTFMGEYRKTGRVDYPLLQEIARRAYGRHLIFPSQARVLFAKLDRAESEISEAIMQLQQGLEAIAQSGDRPAKADPFDRPIKGLVRALNGILAIAREHSEPLEPGIEAGVATCYQDLPHQVNTLRYHLHFLQEHLRTHRLSHEFQRTPFVELRLLSLHDAFDDLQRSSADLSARLREVIRSKLPESESI